MVFPNLSKNDKIVVINGNYSTIIDKEDYDKVMNACTWFTTKTKDLIYVEGRASQFTDKWNRKKKISLHRFLLNLDLNDKVIIDHKNGITLDNRKQNLRMCTVSENGQNSKLMSHNTSGFKGVSWNKHSKKWEARIMTTLKNGTKYRPLIGSFDDPMLGAIAYDKAALKYFGKFARTNKMLGLL